MNNALIRAGRAVDLYWTVTRMQFNPANARILPAAYDPPSPPVVTIIDPDGVTQVTAAPATKADGMGGQLPTGLWKYTYLTPGDGALGIWTAWLDATDSNGIVSGSVDGPDQQKAIPAFQLV